jgi:hypothetical protein
MLALGEEGRVLGAAPFLPLFLQRAGDVYDDAGMRRWLPHGGSWPWLQEGGRSDGSARTITEQCLSGGARRQDDDEDKRGRERGIGW